MHLPARGCKFQLVLSRTHVAVRSEVSAHESARYFVRRPHHNVRHPARRRFLLACSRNAQPPQNPDQHRTLDDRALHRVAPLLLCCESKQAFGQLFKPRPQRSVVVVELNRSRFNRAVSNHEPEKLCEIPVKFIRDSHRLITDPLLVKQLATESLHRSLEKYPPRHHEIIARV